jgi:CheY-like chemotaxis protein
MIKERKTKKNKRQGPGKARGAILVADDDEVIREFIKVLLERAGYAVIEAADGEDALHKFREHKDNILLLIMDVIMPKVTGEEVYEEIKKENPNIRVIFTSGYTPDFIYQKGALHKGTDLILKPLLPKLLILKIKESLNRPV